MSKATDDFWEQLAGYPNPGNLKVRSGLQIPDFPWVWEYSPKNELRDRLNDRLQGKPPAGVWNTRYWRDL